MHENPPPDSPHGILFLLDPRYADSIEAEHKFERAMERAWRDGRLYVQEHTSYQ
jgi:hypothetical protein